jgi:hypothetical protein
VNVKGKPLGHFGEGTGGRILKASLSHEDEAKLQGALNAAKA